MRFPECFVAAEEARELQRMVEKEIQCYISKWHRLMGVSQLQFRHTVRLARSSRSSDSARSGKGWKKRRHS